MSEIERAKFVSNTEYIIFPDKQNQVRIEYEDGEKKLLPFRATHYSAKADTLDIVAGDSSTRSIGIDEEGDEVLSDVIYIEVPDASLDVPLQTLWPPYLLGIFREWESAEVVELNTYQPIPWFGLTRKEDREN